MAELINGVESPLESSESAEDEIVEVVDLDGELYEKLDELEYKNDIYFALIPYKEYDEDEDGGNEEEIAEFGILKKVEDNGEFFLETIDDDDLHDEVGRLFEQRFDEINS